MENEIEKFVTEFFKNLKCEIKKEGDKLEVSNVPKSFEDVYGKKCPYNLSFIQNIPESDFITRGGELWNAINKYLESSGKTTLLKIDFDIDPLKEIEKVITLKNCEVQDISRRNKNNYFSRFTFLTTYRYLNESKQVINEIYVHEGKVVSGDLSGYRVIEGQGAEASNEHLEKDYASARIELKEKLESKTKEIAEDLKNQLEKEVERIDKHYEKQLSELGLDLNSQIEKIKETEDQLMTSEESKRENLLARLDRLRKSLIKMGDDDSKERVLKEKDFTIKDAQQKYSLNIDNKLINTTIIYYPLFVFRLTLIGDKSARQIEMSYNPLTKELDKVKCETCGKEVNRINICSSSHITCDDCLTRCSECSKSICGKCLTKSCSACGKILCKSCAKICMGCGRAVCKNHLRIDTVTGEERCVSCLRACLRCHQLSNPEYFGESLDGSKVCGKCLAEERRNRVIKNIFPKD